MEEFVFIDIWEFLFLLINGTKFNVFLSPALTFRGEQGTGPWRLVLFSWETLSPLIC